MAPPQCVAILVDGVRRSVDLFARGAEWVTALESADVHAIELRHFRFDKQLSLEQLDRLLTSAKAARLRSLVLEHCVLTDRVVAFLVETFGRDTSLASLVVRHCRQLSMTSLLALASLLQAAPLVAVDVSSCQLARQAGMLLGQALQTARSLKRLHVGGNNLRDSGLRAIADGVKFAQASQQNDWLEELDCSNNGLSASSLAALAGMQVKRLVAKDNFAAAFSTAIFTSNSVLESLDVSGNPVSTDAMRELLTHALQSATLKTLNIQNCGLTQSNEEFLAKSLLIRSSSKLSYSLSELYLGERPDTDEDLLDDTDDRSHAAGAVIQTARLVDFKRRVETMVPGLTVHLLETSPATNDGELQRPHEEEEEEAEGKALVVAVALDDVELETPRRQTRRELLERTEFMRRHSEELPLADDDESLVSFVSEDKLPNNKCLQRKPVARSVASAYRGVDSGERELLGGSRRPSSAHSQQLHHSTSNASFFLNHTNPSLDDVASQFSIDPPPSAMASAMQNTDIEFIVSRTIETMNRNFEQRLSQFLLRMEFQQQEKNASQLQMLAAKVEACERAIPRLEARLDVLADRIATSGAQVAKMQNEWSAKAATAVSVSSNPLASTTPLTMAMQHQVDELISSRLRSTENQLQSEVAMLRREVSATAAATQTANPQAVVDAVSVHLTQFKQEFDANQSTVLRRFTENIVKDGARVDERMQKLEGKVAHLEGIIQAEQHASLLALEAISEAFASNNNAQSPALPNAVPSVGGVAVAPVAPLPPPPQPHQHPYVSKHIQQHGYTMVHR